MSSDPPITAPGDDSDDQPASSGWMASLRSRLGLGSGPTLRDSLLHALKADSDNTAFSREEREMLSRLLHFSGSRVEDIRVPRADIIAVEESEPLSELLRTFEEAGVSRIPIFHETLDDPRGMVHIKDLLKWLLREAQGEAPSGKDAGKQAAAAPAPRAAAAVPAATKETPAEPPGATYLGRCDLSRPLTAARIRRPVLFVPPSMPAINLLIRMQSTRIHMALVVDEYGGTDGLVTIEDLVEQIVGDIEDEHDETEAQHIVTDSKLGILASARTPVEEFEKRLGIKLMSPDNEEDIDTLGGLVLALVGRVPARGELVRHASGVEFEVLDADQRRVKKLRVHLPKDAAKAFAAVTGDAALAGPGHGSA